MISLMGTPDGAWGLGLKRCKELGRCIPMIFLRNYWGSLFGVPTTAPQRYLYYEATTSSIITNYETLYDIS